MTAWVDRILGDSGWNVEKFFFSMDDIMAYGKVRDNI